METTPELQVRDERRDTTVSPETLAHLAHLDRLATASVLASGLAHEIANPLACLMTALDALQQRLGGTPLAEDLDVARVSAGAIAAMIRDYQMFLRPNEITPVMPNVDVRPAIERAIVMARAKVTAVSSLELQLSEAPAVRIPATRITQIVLNLLLNAAEALSERPPRENLIVVGLRSLDGNAIIEVRDNGPGIRGDALAGLFEPGRTTKARPGSLGLGLAICSELVRSSGGRISAHAPASGGTLFRILLPPAERPRR